MPLSTTPANSTPVRTLFRPVSWLSSGPDNQEPTCENIKKHCAEKNTGWWGRRTLLEYFGAVGLIVAGILGIFGLKNDNNVGKWIGGIGALVSIVAGGIGVFCGVDLGNKAEDKPEVEKPEEKPTERSKQNKEKFLSELSSMQNIDKEKFLHKVKSLSPIQGADRKEAVKVLLQKSEGSDVIGWLSEILSKEDLTKDIEALDESNVEEAMYCLGQIKDPKVYELLSGYLKDENMSPRYREYALDSLVSSQDDKVLTTLIDFFEDKNCVGKGKEWLFYGEGNRYVRESIAWDLSSMSDQRAKNALIIRLNDKSEDEDLRGNIGHILMRRQYGEKHQKDSDIYNALYACLTDKKEKNEVRRKIADELGQISVYPDTVDELSNLLQALEKIQKGDNPIKDTDQRVICTLRNRIIEHKEGKIGVLIHYLENSSRSASREARELTRALFSQCTEAERERIGNVLYKYLDDKDKPKEIRQTIIDELGQQSVTPNVKEIIRRFILALEKIKLREGDKAVCDNADRPILSTLKTRLAECEKSTTPFPPTPPGAA